VKNSRKLAMVVGVGNAEKLLENASKCEFGREPRPPSWFTSARRHQGGHSRAIITALRPERDFAGQAPVTKINDYADNRPAKM